MLLRLSRSCRLLLLLTLFACSEAPAQQDSSRTPWTSSQLTGTPEPPAPYIVQRIYPELQFSQPVIFTHLPTSERVFVVERTGKIFTFVPSNNPQQALSATPALDLAVDLAAEIEGLQAIYGLAFDPDFENNRFCYICYIAAANVEAISTAFAGGAMERTKSAMPSISLRLDRF